MPSPTARLLVSLIIALTWGQHAALVPHRRILPSSKLRSVVVRHAGSAELVTLDERIGKATKLLESAAVTKGEDSEKVVDALLDLEKDMRARAKEEPKTAEDMLAALDGAWRLVFTTGTIDTQKKIKGRINYFPIKAVQTFDTQEMTLTNGIFLGNSAVLKFFGPFTFDLERRKLEFDFYELAVFGFKFDLGRAGVSASEIGSATGLGSDNNKKLTEAGKKPFFNWVSANKEIATARGGGGGLALWKRDTEMEKQQQQQQQA